MWDYDGWDVLTARQVQSSRDAGALTMFPPSSAPAPACICSLVSWSLQNQYSSKRMRWPVL